jgi:hypothetical protein
MPSLYFLLLSLAQVSLRSITHVFGLIARLHLLEALLIWTKESSLFKLYCYVKSLLLNKLVQFLTFRQNWLQ